MERVLCIAPLEEKEFFGHLTVCISFFFQCAKCTTPVPSLRVSPLSDRWWGSGDPFVVFPPRHFPSQRLLWKSGRHAGKYEFVLRKAGRQGMGNKEAQISSEIGDGMDGEKCNMCDNRREFWHRSAITKCSSLAIIECSHDRVINWCHTWESAKLVSKIKV